MKQFYLTIKMKLDYDSGIATTERRPFAEIVKIAKDKLGENVKVNIEPIVNVKDDEIYFTYLIQIGG